MFKILITDELGKAGLVKLDQAEDADYICKPGLSQEELKAIIPEYDAVIVRSGTQIGVDVLDTAVNLKIIGRAGIGIDNIDVMAASTRGIIVMNTPQANSVATAEMSIAMLLAASRNLAPAHQSLAAGKWERAVHVGHQLRRKKLGIIGLGQVGRLVAKRALAFEMDVGAYDPYISEEVALDLGITLIDLEDLLAHSDYITLHAPLVPETENMINTDTLKLMKDGVILVNVARGRLIDEAALAEALKSGKVLAAALDVYQQEPPENSPLIGLPNVLHTPHLGASTHEAQKEVSIQIVEQVLDALRGTDFRNAINMPFPEGPEFADLRPYILLGEKLGQLHSHMAAGPIRRVEIEVRGDSADDLIKPVAAGILKGILEKSFSSNDNYINYINAPILAQEQGIVTSQAKGVSPVDYTNLISCRAHSLEGDITLAGVLFAGSEPRLVQVDDYTLEAKPFGDVLILKNKDVPGVIGQVGTILAAYEVNIGEWRMGRNEPGGEALSFINVDSHPPTAVIDALEKIPAITQVKLISL